MNINSLKRYLRVGALLCLAQMIYADQPIMNMMPRWDGGYGIQTRLETIHRSDLKLGSEVVGRGFTEDVTLLHTEGVYTWDKSIRFTFKLPYVLDARREVLGPENTKVVQHDSGLGDLTLALPLKKYFNLDGRSGSWTLTPQVRVPLGDKNEEYEVADRVWGSGLFLGYETETKDWFIAIGASGWIFEQPEPAELRGSLDLGWNFREYAQLLIETDVYYDDEEAFQIASGPALYYRVNDRTHVRIEWKHDFISHVSKSEADHGNGDRVSVGVGFVF
ncbi:MAG: transporter [Verrucomicrobiota bacterium]